MIITAPVTDYIPASLLTANGSMIERRTGVISEQLPSLYGRALVSGGVGVNRLMLGIAGQVNHYLKGTGTSDPPAYSTLALRDTGINIQTASVNASSNVVLTGFGFTASVVIFIAHDLIGANLNYSWGFDDGTTKMCMHQNTNGGSSAITINDSVVIYRDAGNNIMGHITVIGGDGITINFVLVGACGAGFIVLAFP